MDKNEAFNVEWKRLDEEIDRLKSRGYIVDEQKKKTLLLLYMLMLRMVDINDDDDMIFSIEFFPDENYARVSGKTFAFVFMGECEVEYFRKAMFYASNTSINISEDGKAYMALIVNNVFISQ